MIKNMISIIMGVYNCESTVSQAIESIIDQTYTNWEFIICDDCSTDGTYKIINEYRMKYPEKIMILKNTSNSKLAFTLNRCLSISKGEYIARMDGDDISKPRRLEEQFNFLSKNRNISLVGTAMQRFDNFGMADVLIPINNPNKYSLRKATPFYHATILTYKNVYDSVGGYTVAKRTERAQDYDLWFKFFNAGFEGANLQKPLYLVREDLDAIKRRSFKVLYNGYKTTLVGYKLLKFPLRWYFFTFFRVVVKSLIPSKIMYKYRQYQKNKDIN